MIGRCKVTRGDLRVEEVLKGTGEGLEEMKRIQRERRRRSTEEANEQVEVRKAEGTRVRTIKFDSHLIFACT